MKGADWLSERVLFGLALIFGYLILGAASFLIPLPDKQASVAHDILSVLGPVIGMVAQAVFRTDKTDKQAADTASQLATAVNTAMTLPAVPKDANPATGETGTDPHVDPKTGLPKGPIPYVELKDVEQKIWPDKP